MKTHDENAEKNFVCKECGEAFLQKCELESHISRTHKNLKVWECDSCDMKFNTNKELQLHKQNEHEADKYPFKCPHCPKRAKTENYLNQHIERVHLKIKNFKCSECGKEFYSKPELDVHYKSVHLKMKPFECETCHKRFPTESHLKAHISRVHNEIKNVICEFCGKAFHQEYELKVHIVRHHADKIKD